MNVLSLRTKTLIASTALVGLMVCGCNKSADSTTPPLDAAPKGGATTTVTPEVQSQIDATQKADAARHAAQAPPGPK